MSSSTVRSPSATSVDSELSADSAGSAGPPVAGREHSREQRWTAGALALAVVAGIVVLAVLGVAATPEIGAVVLSFAVAPSSLIVVVVRVVLVVASGAVAALALVRPLTRWSLPLRGVRVAGWAFGLVAAAAAVGSGLLDDAGWPAVAGHVALVAVVVLGLPRSAAGSTSRHPITAAAVALTTLIALEVSIVRWGLGSVLELVVTFVLTVGIAAALAASTASTSVSSALPARRLVLLAFGTASAVAVLGAAQLMVDGPWSAHDLLHTVRGPVTLAQVVLSLAAATLLVPGLRGTADPAGPESADARFEAWRRELCRWSAGAFAAGLAAVAVLGALPSAPQAPTAGRALVRPVVLGGETEALFVAPTAGGPTLVRLSDTATGGHGAAHSSDSSDSDMGGIDMGGIDMGGMDMGDMDMGDMDMSRRAPVPTAGYSVSAGGPAVPFTTRPGAPGRWAVVDVPAGTDELRVTGPGGGAAVPVTTGPTPADGATLAGPDGPECLDALLGDLVGGGRGVACPSAALSGLDARMLNAEVTELHSRGVRSLHLVGDDSVRSRQADALVRQAAARLGVVINDVPRPEDGLLLLSGWEKASTTLTDATAAAVTAPTYAGGQFLAPWLLAPAVLTAGSSMVVPLSFIPQEPTPRGFAATLATISSDAAPSATGYQAWARARGLPDGDIRLGAAAAIDVMPGMPGMNANDRSGVWMPGGAVVPLTGSLS